MNALFVMDPARTAQCSPTSASGPIDRALTPLWPEVEVIEPDEGIIADVEA